VAELAAGAAGQAVESILDACAAPGGKTLILAERCSAARIVACEAKPASGLTRCATRLAEHAGRIECRLADATVLEEESAFDLVLAGCALQRDGNIGPQSGRIRIRCAPRTRPGRRERQRGLLVRRTRITLARSCATGRIVVYSTCSLEPEENEQVVGSGAQKRPDASLVSFRPRYERLLKAEILTVPRGEIACAADAEGDDPAHPRRASYRWFFICPGSASE